MLGWRAALSLCFAAAFIQFAIVPGIVQGQTVPRIGFLSLASIKSDSRVPSFVAGLKDLGYVDGQTIAVEWRSAEGVADRLPALAKDLVQRKVQVIVAVQPQAIEAARAATKEIPIVFAAAQDPVGMGLATSLSSPGGNVTGTSAMATDLLPKQLELLKLVLPTMTRVAVLLNPTNVEGSRVVRKAIEAAAADGKIAVLFLDARTVDELSTAFGRAKAARVAAVLAGPDSFFVQARAEIAKAAIANGLPTMFLQREHAVAGGMLSYGPNMSANYRRVADYVDRILKGAKAGELPIEQPAKLDLVVNLKTSTAIGVAIPQAVLMRADEVLR